MPKLTALSNREPLATSYRFFAGVNQFPVDFVVVGRRTHSEDTVLTAGDDLTVLGQIVGDQRGNADTQIDVTAIGNILRNAPRSLPTRATFESCVTH